jgi:hypothetical protein
MLETQIIHLKNVIVFKIVVCTLIFSLFFWLIPSGRSRLDDSMQHKEIAISELEAVESKVQFIKESSSLVGSTYQAYLDALKNPFSVSCIAQEGLVAGLTTLGEQFRLRDRPMLQLQPIPTMERFRSNPSVQILTTTLDLSFPAQGFAHALGFSKAAYKILPIYSLLDSVIIEANSVITPSTITELAVGAEPQLIDARLGIKMREIKVAE